MWYIGMDVGGTHIDCVAFSDNGARSEYQHQLPVDTVPELAAPEVVERFMRDLGIKPRDVKDVAVGWKHGRNEKRVLVMMRQFAKHKLQAKIFWDAETAFIGAIPGKVGVVVVSGTSSVVYGRTSSGKVLINGGWSPLLGDPGSAFSLGQKGLIAALRAQDHSGQETLLEKEIPRLARMKLEEIVIAADTDMPRAVPLLASFAPLIFRLAEQGDAEAIRIRNHAAQHVSERLLSVLALWPNKDTLVVSYAGRLMHAQSAFRQQIQKQLASEKIELTWYTPQFRAPFGALLARHPELLKILDQANQSLDWHH